MKIIAMVLSLIPVLFGCDNQSAEEKTREPERIALTCGRFEVVVKKIPGADTLKATINGEEIQMNQVEAASGARYAGRGAVVSASLWSHGANWSLSLDRGRPISCRSLR